MIALPNVSYGKFQAPGPTEVLEEIRAKALADQHLRGRGPLQDEWKSHKLFACQSYNEVWGNNKLALLTRSLSVVIVKKLTYFFRVVLNSIC
ncbi:hypothetical protein AMTR_s00144p00024030 [Amborella trichopoda]|uniref:Uncharacterized protein n=1 Tax=Amborella trichopoda TaxID=13333 RepID=W1P7R0_AMBTC|nr:hypothetical protein AMTR_s00144p00024030 [Amborella trichopoda]